MTLGSVLGTALSLLLLCFLALGARLAWRAPFRALGLLVAGMAFHNFVLMVLIRLGTPAPLIRAVQAWKELLLAVLLLAAIAFARSHWGGVPRLLISDWLAIGFTVLVVVYCIAEVTPAGNDASLAQVLVSLRLALLMPLLYLFGRLFLPRTAKDLGFAVGAILASAAAVGLFGLGELWLVPTREWIQWGAVGFSQWLGFDYGGPQGLPANFFQTTSSGLLLRRMVSTYLSPLGVAYTGLLVVPIAFLSAISPWSVPKWPQWARYFVLAMVVLSVALAMTRLALASIAAESVLLAILLRRSVAAGLAAVVVSVAFLSLFAYPYIGPVLSSSLHEANSPTSFLREPAVSTIQPWSSSTSPQPASSAGESSHPTTSPGSVIPMDDPSIRAHVEAVASGIDYIIHHPMGTGVGSAVPRYGSMQGPSESALLRIGGELGVLGALLYAGLYMSALVAAAGLIRRRGLRRAIGIATLVGALGLLPISLTSDVWGDFSVTFLFWWLAGLAASGAALRHKVAAVEWNQA